MAGKESLLVVGRGPDDAYMRDTPCVPLAAISVHGATVRSSRPCRASSHVITAETLSWKNAPPKKRGSAGSRNMQCLKS